MNKLKRLFKSKIFWSVSVVLVLVTAVAARMSRSGQKVEHTTQAVSYGNIVQTVSATGQVKSASEIELNFKNTGTVAVLNVDTGNQVKAGDILAQLKAADLAANVSRAQADVTEAKSQLDKVIAGATTQDIAVYQAAVAKAQTDLTNAEIDLVNTKNTYQQAIDNAEESLLVDINSALTKAEISLQVVNDTLNYEGDEKNFQTSNLYLENQVGNGYTSALAKISQAKADYSEAKADPTDTKIEAATLSSQVALSQVETTVDDLKELLESVITTAILTQSELETLKVNISAEQKTTDASIDTVESSKQSLADAKVNYATKVSAAQNAVSVAQKNLVKAQADLEFRQAPARPEDISLYRARLQRAQADLQYAQDKYDETILRAPIAGVVTEVNFEVGEQTSLSQPAIKMLATENYEIEVDIPESDITKIEVGYQAQITLDAFSDDDIFQGTVTTINPAQTEIQDVIYYKVTVSLADLQPERVSSLVDKIKPGMTANIEIETDRRENVLVVPSRAIKRKNGNQIVEVLVSNKPEERTVGVGLSGDDSLTEIVSGLSVGDLVITFAKEK